MVTNSAQTTLTHYDLICAFKQNCTYANIMVTAEMGTWEEHRLKYNVIPGNLSNAKMMDWLWTSYEVPRAS